MAGASHNTFFDIKIGCLWRGDALMAQTVANFDNFNDQNTHFAHGSTVFMLSGDIFIA